MYKSLIIGHDLQEAITYERNTLPLVTCIDRFDEYFQREWPCHWHEEFELCVVRQGRIVYTLYDGGEEVITHELSPGDGLYIASRRLHSAKALLPDTVVDTVVFPLRFFDVPAFQNIFQQNIQPLLDANVPQLLLPRKDENTQPLREAIATIATLPPDEPCHELHLIELVGRIWRLLLLHIAALRQTPVCAHHQLQADRLKILLSYIHTHIQLPLSVDTIAQAANISRTECFRCFKTVLRQTPQEYITNYRIAQASAMLLNTRRTVADIAEACGFNTPSYFGRIFRQQCGCTPKEYRQQGIEKESGGKCHEKQHPDH